MNNAGISYLARTMATSKAGLGEVVKAYIETDRQTGAADKRAKVLAGDRKAKAEHEALLEIEAELEQKTLAALAGTTKASAGR